MKNKKLILGISAFYHDSASSLIENGEILFAVQEERFTRKKHDAGFPLNSVRACIDYYKKINGLSKINILENLDAVVFYEKPLLKFERLLETYYSFAPKGINQFIHSMPLWIKEKMFIKNIILEELGKIEEINPKKIKLLFSEHHISHAASAFYPSAFKEAAIITIDGAGEWATATIGHGIDNRIEILKELKFPHSLGLLYSAFTYYAGFKVNSGEYKLMGLAPYGNHKSEQVMKIRESILNNMIDIKNDGSLWLNQEYFDYSVGLKMCNEKKWEKLFGFSKRKPETELLQEYCDMALALQQITEEIVIKMAKEAKRLTGSDNLCLAGGVALNCVANGRIKNLPDFDKLWIQPAAGDAGGSLGSALAVNYMYFNQPRSINNDTDSMKGSYLGPEFDNIDVEFMAKKYNAFFEKMNDEELFDMTSELLRNGNIIGWHQGKMEWGPRALGNRSILADARNKEMQKRLNLKIKYRESFRPFAPSVLYENSHDYFIGGYASPYMLLIDYIKPNIRKELPENFNNLSVREKLYFFRSDIPAITHVDFSARLQTVHKETNPKYYKLIESFMKKTGYGIIVNTSFNVRGEPIVCTPEDSYKCFMRTEMDYLVINNYIFNKKKQPVWTEKDNWKEEYTLD